MQTLLDPSNLFARAGSGVDAVLLRWEDLGGTLDIEANAGELARSIRDSRQWQCRPLLVVCCPSSPHFLASPERAAIAERCQSMFAAELRGVGGVHVITPADVARQYPVADYHDAEGERLAHMPYTPRFLAALAATLVRRIDGMQRAPYKVIVLDCDNTLWRGVVGEDGVEGIGLDPAFEMLQRFLLEQRDAGMLLCLCSKNNEDDVWEVFHRRADFPLRREHIVSSRINWAPKSSNIQELARELDLGLDSFVFVDDNAKECAEMQANCPEVLTLLLPERVEDIPEFIRHVWVFDHWQVTADDRTRSLVYGQKLERERLEKRSASIGDFIAGLKLEVCIEPLVPEHLPRVSQLTLRTNQFNCTTVRRTEADIEGLLRAGYHCLTVDVSDRFGSYGLVGAVLYRVDRAALAVDSFMLSCRALGRGVEHRVLNHLGRLAQEAGVGSVTVPFVPTAKNHPARGFLEGAGVDSCAGEGDRVMFDFPAARAATLLYDPAGAVPATTTDDSGKKQPKSAASARPRCDYGQNAHDLRHADAILSRISVSRPPAALGVRRGVHAAPRSETERRLAVIWAQTLGLDAIGVDESFFDLGGTSLLAVKLLSSVIREFGRESLTLSMVLSAPTVAQFSRFVEFGHLPDYECLVPIRTNGSRPPLYYVHGAGGNVLSLRPLAFEFPDDQPFYGLQAKGLDGSEPFGSVRETALHYVEEIRRFQPEGPYYVGGGCYGGLVAFEMAHVLREQGQEVGLLALIDSYNVAYGTMISKPHMIYCNARFIVQRTVHHLRRVRGLHRNERREYLHARLQGLLRYQQRLAGVLKGTSRSHVFNELEQVRSDEGNSSDYLVETLNRVIVANTKAQREYVPRAYDGPVAIFKAEVPSVEPYQERYLGWGPVVAEGQLTDYVFPGDHYIGEETSVRALAQLIGDSLHAAQVRRAVDVTVSI